MQPGQGQGLSLRDLGEMSGVESITLLQSEIPLHSHSLASTNEDGKQHLAGHPLSGRGSALYVAPAALGMMAPQALALAGGSLPHNNMQPYLTLNFCIALQGIFPQRP
jgi:microcystin-dependent protein